MYLHTAPQFANSIYPGLPHVGIRKAYAVVIPLLVAALLISQRAQRMVARRVEPWPAPDLSDSGGRVV